MPVENTAAPGVGALSEVPKACSRKALRLSLSPSAAGSPPKLSLLLVPGVPPDIALLRQFDREPRAITHAQIELLAARMSALNQCVY